ncbi:hypothetical protein BB560_000749 [Smittium megazygosporum]|uniref:Chromatin modification-related protein EAF7 n=1 Tax=Smittium megazygosporum TaxID=133381 RepID=A0A2T9ZJK6_9FUNG|nr:hypothetical protein BB560_000749 [Smittium megazygosporum]
MSNLNWDTHLDLCLLQAMSGLRPVEKVPHLDISAQDLWSRLREWYDLEVLEELENDSDSELQNYPEDKQKEQERENIKPRHIYTIERPDDPYFWKQEAEFCLPWDEYGVLILERAGEGVEEVFSPSADGLSQDQLSSKYSTPESTFEEIEEEPAKPVLEEVVPKKKSKPVPPSKRKKYTRQSSYNKRPKRR